MMRFQLGTRPTQREFRWTDGGPRPGYLSLDCLNLCLQAVDHAIHFGDLGLGIAQIISGLSRRGLHLLVLSGIQKEFFS